MSEPNADFQVDGNRMRWLLENYGFTRPNASLEDDDLADFIQDLREDFKSEASTETRTPCPVCPHWLELHNDDGSCGCGMNCAAI